MAVVKKTPEGGGAAGGVVHRCLATVVLQQRVSLGHQQQPQRMAPGGGRVETTGRGGQSDKAK